MVTMEEMKNIFALRYSKFRDENYLEVGRRLREIDGDPTTPAGRRTRQKLEVIENGSKELVDFLVNLMKEYADKQPDIIEFMSENGTKIINSHWDGGIKRIKRGISPLELPIMEMQLKNLEEAKLLTWSCLKRDIDLYKAENKIESYTKPDSINRKEYDVVLSFAGEDREHAEKLANLLKKDGFRHFYDKDEEHNLWGKNLHDHFTKIFSECGRYCVMFLSNAYEKKLWPKVELSLCPFNVLKQ